MEEVHIEEFAAGRKISSAWTPTQTEGCETGWTVRAATEGHARPPIFVDAIEVHLQNLGGGSQKLYLRAIRDGKMVGQAPAEMFVITFADED